MAYIPRQNGVYPSTVTTFLAAIADFMPYVDMGGREATPAIAEGLYRVARFFSTMQTGTTPTRRIVTEPASSRSAPPTGTCQRSRFGTDTDPGVVA